MCWDFSHCYNFAQAGLLLGTVLITQMSVEGHEPLVFCYYLKSWYIENVQGSLHNQQD